MLAARRLVVRNTSWRANLGGGRLASLTGRGGWQCGRRGNDWRIRPKAFSSSRCGATTAAIATLATGFSGRNNNRHNQHGTQRENETSHNHSFMVKRNGKVENTQRAVVLPTRWASSKQKGISLRNHNRTGGRIFGHFGQFDHAGHPWLRWGDFIDHGPGEQRRRLRRIAGIVGVDHVCRDDIA